MTNEELDAKVLASIRSGKIRAGAVQAHLDLGVRELDRSLQRLRRKGFVKYGKHGKAHAGWHAVAGMALPARAG